MAVTCKSTYRHLQQRRTERLAVVIFHAQRYFTYDREPFVLQTSESIEILFQLYSLDSIDTLTGLG